MLELPIGLIPQYGLHKSSKSVVIDQGLIIEKKYIYVTKYHVGLKGKVIYR